MKITKEKYKLALRREGVLRDRNVEMLSLMFDTNPAPSGRAPWHNQLMWLELDEK